MTGFPLRGVVEGFYGPPWPWDARLRLVSFLAEHGFNAYAYAPKDDPLHRDRWREPYLPEDWARFAQLRRHCTEAGIEFVFGLSPLGVRFADGAVHPDDLEALRAKYAAADAVGVRTFCLLVDDMPARGSDADGDAPAGADVQLARAVHELLAGFGPNRRLWFIPQPYCGDPDTHYLRQLGAGLPSAVEVCWTGPRVCSAEVTLDHARRVETSLRRRFLLWDNHPVNDGAMRHDPHLGPLRGRDPRLPEAVHGIVANLALQPEASCVAVATVGDYAAGPGGYDPKTSWRRALLAVAGDRADAEAVAALADLACRSPLEPGRRANALTPAIEAFWERWEEGADRHAAVSGLEDSLARLAAHADRLTGQLCNDRLRVDLLPWSRKLADLVSAARLGLEVLRRSLPEAGPPDGGSAIPELRWRVLKLIDSARASSYWVAGDQLDAFARGCLRASGGSAGHAPAGRIAGAPR